VNVRVLSATNAELAVDIREGRFREDLFYRLNVIELALPPLNARRDDILPLVGHFVGPDFSLNKQTQQVLVEHQWPGNVRELENVCKRAVILAQDTVLTVEDFGLIVGSEASLAHRKVEPKQAEDLDKLTVDESHSIHSSQVLAETKSGNALGSAGSRTFDKEAMDQEPLDKASIEAALAEHSGVIARVAKSLGLSRQALYRRMEKFGIDK